MLQFLRIKNLALLEEQSLELNPGFIAVTGETGAGKSVLLGALRILSGARVDKTLIRQNQDTCEIEASIHLKDSQKIDTFLENAGLPLCEDHLLLLRRTLSKTKSPRIQINGSLSTLSVLQELGERWIDFHGPGEPQKLFQEKHQLSMLDYFSHTHPLVDEYLAIYSNWKRTLKQIEILKKQEHLNEDELAFLQSQIDKIEQIDPSAESIEKLESDYTRIAKAQEISEYAGTLENGLSGEDGASHKLSQLVRYAQSLATIMPQEGNVLLDRLQSLIIECEDLASEYNALGDNSSLESENIASIHERMDLWLEIKRKYGPDLDSVIAKHQTLASKIHAQSNIEETLEKLSQEASQLETKARKLAQELSQKREQAANTLAPQVMQVLKKLGFKHAQLRVAIHTHDELTEQGLNTCSFLFAPNAGQDLLPLNKIASSGETARVMLALKAILAKTDQTPVLVFDEVDSNVGGEIGAEVGRCLAELGEQHQVLCVTHLPQVASQAMQHFVVDKHQSETATTVSILPIHDNRDHRLQEIARMLGDRDSTSARQHAEALICR